MGHSIVETELDQILASGVSVTLVHLTHAIQTRVGDEWRIACMPGMTEFHKTPYHPNYQRTDDVRGVTCPACKRSQVFAKAKQALEAATKGPVDVG